MHTFIVRCSTALAVVLSTGGTAWAVPNVVIRDDARVLSSSDRQRIIRAAEPAHVKLTVWTVNGGFAGKRAQFVQASDSLAGGDTVVIAVDLVDRYSHVAARQNTGFTANAMVRAKAATTSFFTRRRWADGIISALDTLVPTAARSHGNRS